MSKFRMTTAVATIMIVASTPFALAQTTLGGSAQDNSASGGRENGTTADAGRSAPMKGEGTMMKSNGMTKGGMSGADVPAANQMNKGAAPMANGK